MIMLKAQTERTQHRPVNALLGYTPNLKIDTRRTFLTSPYKSCSHVILILILITLLTDFTLKAHNSNIQLSCHYTVINVFMLSLY